MNSNNNNENINSNTNIKTDVYSIINDNSNNKVNQTQSKSSEFIFSNNKGEREIIGIQKLIMSSSSDIILQESNNLNNSKHNSKINNKNKKETYNILVAVRCRPLSKKEKDISTKETIKIIDEKTLKLKDPNSFLNPNNVRAKEKVMNFDFAFSPLINQEQIFNCTTKFLIDKVINGFNATVFAYGVTGAGKTYTMLGNDDNPGIMVWTLKELYKKIKEYKNREYLIKLWYVEIYNENIRDLLSNKGEKNENLELREDPDEGIIINNITEIITNSMNEILNLLKKGNKNRTVEETDVNKTSSRSHAILQIKVSFKESNNENNTEVRFGKLNLIDLAGSERASTTKNRGLRLIEGANINKSLLTLGNCINALVEKNKKGSKVYIPYRDSKLTRLLKDSLGGNSRTVMIANISPFIYNFDDTYNTLKYAERAKCIKTKVKVNIVENNKSNDFMKLIKNLNNKLNKLGNKLTFANVNLNININNDKKNKRIHSMNYKQNNSSNKRKRHTYNFHENTFSDNDTNIKTKNEKNNIKDVKNQNLNNDDINNKYEENKINNDIIDELVKEKDKKIGLIIEDYIQQSEAEIQLKQKIINIHYNLILLYNKIQKNLSFKKNNAGDKIKLKNLKKMLEKNIETLNEMTEKNENFIKKYIESNENEENIEFSNLQKKYMYIIFKDTKIQKENIEIKFKYTIMKNENEKKDNYLKELEKQIKLRDLIIKELLFFDSAAKQNKKQEKNETRNNINNILSKILKKENNFKYQTLSQLKRQNNIFSFNNNKPPEDEINNRHNTINLDNNYENNLYHNTNGTNKEYFNEKEDYIIDFDKENSIVNNTYINLKIPSLIKSNSSFNINNFQRKISKKFLSQKNKNKTEVMPENDKNKFSHIKYIKEDLNYKMTELEKNNKEENSNNIKSILTKIKNTNNEISSKMSIIEQQSNRNRKLIGISGQINNQKYEKNNTAILFNKKYKEDKLIKLNHDNLTLNITREKHSLKKILLENLNKENNDVNYTINLQMNNNKISNRKSQERQNLKTKLIQSENNKKKNSKIINYDKFDSSSALRKIDLSKEKTDIKQQEKFARIKRSKIIENLMQTKNFINTSNQDNINSKKKYEKNKSAINIIKIQKERTTIHKNENERKKNKNINLKLIKDSINNKKYNTMYIATNFNDKNQVYIQNKTSFIKQRNQDKNLK